MSARIALFLAAVALFVAVAAGAFGAHTLGRQIGPERLALWQTAGLLASEQRPGLHCATPLLGLNATNQPAGHEPSFGA